MEGFKRTIIKTARTYLQAVIGLWPVFGTGIGVLPPREAGIALATAAYAALFPAALTFLQNALEELASFKPTETLRGG